MTITPLEFNCLQVGLDHLIECLEEGKETQDDEIKLDACKSVKKTLATMGFRNMPNVDILYST